MEATHMTRVPAPARWFHHEDRKFLVDEYNSPRDNRKWLRIGPIAVPIDEMRLYRQQQLDVSKETLCWPVIRYRPSWHIMGRVNVHDKMHGMLWL